MRAIIITLCGVALSACATTNYNAMETAEVSAGAFCEQEPFPGVADCVQNRFDKAYPRWRSDANADLVNIFLAWSRAAGARVAQGTLSDIEARRQAYALQARLDQIAQHRRVDAQINSERAAAMMLGGLAIMAAAQPQPVMIQPTVVPVPVRQSVAPITPFPSAAPAAITPPQFPKPPVPAPPIVCSVMGNAQLATAVCH